MDVAPALSTRGTRRQLLGAASAASLLWLAGGSTPDGSVAPSQPMQAHDFGALRQRLHTHLGAPLAESLLIEFEQRVSRLAHGAHLESQAILSLMHREDIAQGWVLHIDAVCLSQTQASIILSAIQGSS
jgi:hypothetical protein